MENLTSLSLEVDTSDVLERAPRLQRAKLELTIGVDETYPTRHIPLSCLHTLDLAAELDYEAHADLEGGGAEMANLMFRRFLACLQFPALKTLFIDLDYREVTTKTLHWGGVADLLFRSGATLQNLEVSARTMASFPLFLEALPTLKHLAITDILLQHCLSTGCHAQLCRNLGSLRILNKYYLAERAVIVIRSIIDESAVEGPIAARPLVLVVPSRIRGSLSLPPGSNLELVDDDDWIARQQHDLYEKTGANW